MGFISFLILGLLAGSIAKAILPGLHHGGWFTTLILGVVGAFVGGWLGGIIFDTGVDKFFSFSSWLLAIVGSIIVLLIFSFFTGRKVER